MTRLNLHAIRFVSVAFIVGGAIMVYQFGRPIMDTKATISWFGEMTSDFGPKAITAASPLFVLVAGIFMLRASNRGLKKGHAPHVRKTDV